jgi:oxalate---CoA ligase
MHLGSCAAIRAISHYAATDPGSLALIEPDGIALDYDELWKRICAVSRILDRAGVNSNETVAVLLPQGPQQVVGTLGILNCCVCAPLQPRTTVAEVQAALRALSASALITTLEFAESAEAAREMGLAVILASHGQHPNDWDLWSSVSQRRAAARYGEAILIMITSATTGTAKQVPLTATNLDAGIRSRCEALRLSAGDRMLLMTSLSHIIGVENVLAQYQVGGSVIATGGFDPTAYLNWVQTLKPSWYDCAPTVHQAALAEFQRHLPQLPTSLRFVQSAGAPLPAEVKTTLEEILGVPVFNDYGMTEACPIAIDAFLEDGHVPASAGRSCGLEIGIRSSSGQLLPIGKEGEIVVRGPAVFGGYPDDPEATALAFCDGWFRTGDVGRLDSAGNLFIAGRLKEMINRGGEKILPAEVDAVVASHPAVLEAAAFSVPHRTLGEDVACAVVLRDATSHPVSALELRRFAAQRLPVFKVPHRICFVDQIPRGELGKPQRWQLAQTLGARRAVPPAPSEVTHRKLAYDLEDVFYKLHEIWARLLDRDDLGFDEDFFDAGGDSLAAINMLLEVDQRFGCHTSESAASFLDEPTLSHLTNLVYESPRVPNSQSDSGKMQIFPVRKGTADKTLFCVPADEEEGLYFRRLATHLAGDMDLSIVRPVNTRHNQTLLTFENAGKEVAALIRDAQPQGPYFIGGYCYGGVVAVEAVRALHDQGQKAQLILFDVPMPGAPTLLTGWRPWLRRFLLEWRLLSDDRRRIGADFFDFVHRLAWFAVNPFRSLLTSVEQYAIVQKIVRYAQQDYLPLYRPRPIQSPALHFLCEDEPHILGGAARFAWRKIARNGISEVVVSHDHSNLLHESNLPRIAETIRQWCASETTEHTTSAAQPLAAEIMR